MILTIRKKQRIKQSNMKNCTKKLLIIGAVPPPFIGPYLATQKILDHLQNNNRLQVTFLDISDHRDSSNIGKLDLPNLVLGVFHISKCCWLLTSKRIDQVYISVSQGIWGYLRDLGFMIPSVILGKKLIIHLRGSEFDTFFESMPSPVKRITRFVFSRTHRVIVLSENFKPIFSKLIEKERIVTIPNGIDYKEFDSLDTPNDPKGNGKKILYLSNLRERKGYLLFLKSIPGILEKQPNTEFTVAGQFRTDEEQHRAQNLINLLGIERKVSFIGEVHGSDKIAVYRAHDIFIFPPIMPEGLPWVILEAMSARLPVLSTAQGAIPEVVVDGQTGFIVPPEIKPIIERTCFLLENPVAAHKMGQEGYLRVVQNFSEEKYLSRLTDVLSGNL